MLEKELEEIISKERDIIPFLKKLNPKEKRELVTSLKKLYKEYYATREVKEKSNGYTYMKNEFIKSEKQRKIAQSNHRVSQNRTKRNQKDPTPRRRKD